MSRVSSAWQGCKKRMANDDHDEIKAALKEMGLVLRATYVPELTWISDLRAAWPDAPHEQLSLKDRFEQWEQGGAPIVRVWRQQPSPEAIDRADKLLWLVMALPNPHRKITIGWAIRNKMRDLAKDCHISKRKAWYVFNDACLNLEKSLHTSRRTNKIFG